MHKTKVIMIGTGRIAKEHIKCLMQLPSVNIVGVCDLSAAKAESTAERCGITLWDTNYEELIRKTNPDIAHITTNPASHFLITKNILNSNVSAFVEKPITLSFPEFQILQTIAETKRLILLENHNYLFNPPMQSVFTKIQTGEFGEVKHVNINLCIDFTPPKQLYQPLATCQEFITHLASLSNALIGPHKEVYTSWKNQEPENGYDQLSILVKGRKGTVSIYLNSKSAPEGFWVEVFGSKMRASINLFESHQIFEKNRILPRPLSHFTNGIHQSFSIFKSSFESLWNKLKGNPSGYSGLNILLKKTYEAIEKKDPLPIDSKHLNEVNQLVAAILTQAPIHEKTT